MLYVLRAATPKLRSAIIKNADPQLIKTLCEISYNTLRGNTKLCPKTKKILSGYKRELRHIGSPKRSLLSKRKILVQRGGFIPTLIGAILSGIIGSYLNKD